MEQNLNLEFPAVATIEYDAEAHDLHWETYGEPMEEEQLTIEIIREISNLPQVKDYDYFLTTPLFSSSLVGATSFSISDLPPEAYLDIENFAENLRSEMINSWEFLVRGVSNANLLDVATGLISLDLGRIFTKEEVSLGVNVAIVSREMANENNFQLGSRFILENEELSEEFSFEIVGIFDVAHPFDWSDGNHFISMQLKMQILNRIYVPINAIADVVDNQYNYLGEFLWETVFLLENHRDLQNFAEDANVILPDGLVIQDLSVMFRRIYDTMDTMIWLSSLILWGAVIAITLLACLVIVLFLHDRRNEIGIYLALGEKKVTIILQLLIEVGVVSFVATAISLLAGVLISNGLSARLLESYFSNHQRADFNALPFQLRTLGANGLPMDEIISAFDTSLNTQSVLLIFLTGMLIVLISTIVPIIFVMSFKPKKILL